MKTKPVASDAAAKPPDSEKITINLGFVDLGQIDLLVDVFGIVEGWFKDDFRKLEDGSAPPFAHRHTITGCLLFATGSNIAFHTRTQV